MDENLFFFFFSESTDFVGSFHTLLTFHFQNALFFVVISLVYGRENAGEGRWDAANYPVLYRKKFLSFHLVLSVGNRKIGKQTGWAFGNCYAVSR